MRAKFLIILLIILFGGEIGANANFSVSGNYYKVNESDIESIDAVFVFNNITSTTTITYQNTDFVEWQDYEGNFVANTPQFSPDEGGYRVKTTGVDQFIWVFDYSNYIVNIHDVQCKWFDEDKCTSLLLEVTLNDVNKVMSYRTKNGETKEIPRKFTLTYTDTEWSGSAWTEKEVVVEQSYPFSSIPIESPLCNTTFKLQGDKYADAFELNNQFETAVFNPIAVKAYPKGEISKREALNEIDQNVITPSVSGGASKNCKCKQELLTGTTTDPIIGGSAPLVVDFKSNTNEDAVDFVEWFITDNTNPSQQRIRYTDKDFRYTFNNAGEYTIKLVASSAECEYTDSVKVAVLDSFIDVPNVFTPNGDGMNDEFRVVYRSLLKFSGSVYNRWGRLVFRWTDPAKGWDGRINRKKAAPGAYYYVIMATGADKDKKGENIEWKCGGDINLLGGKK